MPPNAEIYLEKIAALANLGGERRDYHINKLRAQLQTAMASNLATGWPQEQAEQEAMKQLGAPEEVARRLGSSYNWLWLVFQIMAFTVPAYLFVGTSAMRLYDAPQTARPWFLLAALTFAGISSASTAWKRVSVNGTLRIHRFLRPAKSIPRDSIRAIKMESGRLFGERRIEIHYGDYKSAVIGSSYKGFPLAAATLRHFHAPALDADVTAYFDRMQTAPATPALWKKLLASASWILAAALVLVMSPLLWRNEALPLFFAGGLLLGWVTAMAQAGLLRDIAKSSLFALLAGGLYWALGIVFGHGSMYYVDVRPYLLFAVVLIPLGLILTWWKNRTRIGIVAFSAIAILAVFGISKSLPKNLHAEFQSLGEVRHMIDSAILLETSSPTAPRIFSLGLVSRPKNDKSRDQRYSIAFADGDNVSERELPPGTWSLVGPVGPETFLLSQRTQSHGDWDSTVHFHTVDTNLNLRDDVTASGTSTLMESITPVAIISPDSRYLLCGTSDSMQLVIVDRQSSSSFPVHDLNLREVWKWESSSTLALLTRPTLQPKKISSGEVTRMILNVETRETSVTGKLQIGRGNSLYWAPGKTHALIRGEKTFGIANLEDGTSLSLPLNDEDAPLEWDWTKQQVVYTTPGPAPEIILAGETGVIARAAIEPNRKFASFKISPDSTQVLTFSKIEQPYTLPLGQLAIWNTKTNDFLKIEQKGPVITILTMMQATTIIKPHHPVLWTSDGKRVIWPGFYMWYQPENVLGAQWQMFTPGYAISGDK